MSGQQPADAVRPVDVVIVDRFTGAEIPCELAYEGVDDDGITVWLVSKANVFDPRRHLLKIGMMPARTAIGFPTVQPFGGGDGQ